MMVSRKVGREHHDRRLILLRHGESEANRRDFFGGWLDIDLTDEGIAQAHRASQALADDGVVPESVFSSSLVRARRTAEIVLSDLHQTIPVTPNPALNERNYGVLTGLDKDHARERWGREQVEIWRRSYEVGPPNGESLRDTAARVLQFYINAILPAVMRAGPALVVAHGNSLRTLIMALDGLSSDLIGTVEIATGEMIVYDLAPDTSIESKRRISTAN
jgi:2,3-bisphosphoglycerate-dependent phosphoglycerate mutase